MKTDITVTTEWRIGGRDKVLPVTIWRISGPPAEWLKLLARYLDLWNADIIRTPDGPALVWRDFNQPDEEKILATYGQIRKKEELLSKDLETFEEFLALARARAGADAPDKS